MNRKLLILMIVILISLVSVKAIDLGSIGDSFKEAGTKVMTYDFVSFYEGHQRGLDYFLFVMIFNLICYLGLSRWFKEQKITVMLLSFVVGAALGIAAVQAGMTVKFFIPFVKNALLFIVWGVIFFLLTRPGIMDKHKFWAFILSIVIAFVLFNVLGLLENFQLGKGERVEMSDLPKADQEAENVRMNRLRELSPKIGEAEVLIGNARLDIGANKFKEAEDKLKQAENKLYGIKTEVDGIYATALTTKFKGGEAKIQWEKMNRLLGDIRKLREGEEMEKYLAAKAAEDAKIKAEAARQQERINRETTGGPIKKIFGKTQNALTSPRGWISIVLVVLLLFTIPRTKKATLNAIRTTANIILYPGRAIGLLLKKIRDWLMKGSGVGGWSELKKLIGFPLNLVVKILQLLNKFMRIIFGEYRWQGFLTKKV